VKLGTTDVKVRSVPCWRRGLVTVVMLSLVLTLATRTFHSVLSHTTTVKSGASQAIRQHLDRDAVRWTAPAATVTISQIPRFIPRATRVAPPLPVLLQEESLYNRPPPAV
jgi:hypothetical protein